MQTKKLQQQFKDRPKDRRFIPVNPTDCLDYAGTEFILISTDDDSAEDIESMCLA